MIHKPEVEKISSTPSQSRSDNRASAGPRQFSEKFMRRDLERRQGIGSERGGDGAVSRIPAPSD